ncbi:MAG: gliding motility protein GldB [Bacteroidota bacterium]
MKQTGFALLLIILLSGGCNWFKSSPDVSDIEVDFELVPFYEDLFAIHPDSVEQNVDNLKSEYGNYLKAYSEGIIKIGSPEDGEYTDNLSKFLAYEPNKEVYDTCRKVFSDKEQLKNEISRAFRYYKHYFPERETPDVYLHISGFNESVAVDSGWVSVSVEKYLGRDCVFYEWLQTPEYLRTQMEPERVVPDIMRAIGMTEYAYNDSVNDLISQMVYHGKMLHFVEHTIPEIPDTLLFGYSEDQMEWCRTNEAFMWETMIEKKHLFSTEQDLIRKYVGDAPFTNFFGQESPGRTGRYIGYKLMESWMDQHSEKSFKDMMEATDPHNILSNAGYRP